jgi:NAD(P)-dependent dehydrogenase (short-subunit alcohol dehydrogenase family)
VDLQDKVAIVTGASRGIGRQIALELSRRGAKVVVAARTFESRRALPGTLGETLTLIEDAGGEAIATQCDVTKVEDLERLVSTTVARFGRLDVVVNNAADMAGVDLDHRISALVGQPCDVDARSKDVPLDNWLRQFATNVHAPYLLMGLAIPHLHAQGGGVIVNMSSRIAELVPVQRAGSLADGEPALRNPGLLGYATTKAALNRLTNAAAAELASFNIAVIAVAPGDTRTETIELLAEHGMLDASTWTPMTVPVAAVLGVLTADDPMALTGEIIEVQPGSE